MDIVDAIVTSNKCYQAAIPLRPQGIMLHSIGCTPVSYTHLTLPTIA